MKIQTRLKGAAAPIALSIALIAQPAFAQASTSDEDILTADDLADENAQPEQGGAIVVTGSRIRRSEATSAAPLQIIDPEIARRGGRNSTAEMIQFSPIASGSSQITAAISANTISNGGPGAQTISLRGLGATRTLVLLNSRRAGPAGTRGAVSAFDLNVIPGSIIESVEILKDGASSIYGSDAIAGVVNILTKKSTDGLELDGFASVPFESGGEEYSITGAWGKEWSGGHIMFSGEYYRQNMMRRQDRDFLDCEYDYLFRTEDGDERVDLVDPRTGELRCDGAAWGHVWAYYSGNLPDQPVTLLQYSYGNDNLGAYLPPLVASQPGDLIVPDGWYGVNYQTRNSEALLNLYHPFQQKSTINPEVDRYTAYVDGAMEVGSGLEVYGEGLFNRRRTYVDSYSQFYTFGYTDLYAPGDPEDPFPGFSGLGGIPQFISPTGILDNYDQEITVDYYRGVLGLRGDITDRIGFDAYGQYSLSDGKYKFDQILGDVIDQQTARGFGAGCAGLVTEISGRECLQLNWTDPRVMAGDLTPEEEAYLTGTETGHTKYEQMYVEAIVSGEAFDLPAGPLGFALGATIRRDEIDDTPGEITYALVPGGDPDNPDDYTDNGFQNPYSSGHTFGHSITKELFGEVEVPVLADVPFAQHLTLSGAARITNVKAVRGSDGESASSNGNWTYKLAADWQVNDWLRFRGTYGTSYRAPALFEQFLADQVSGLGQRDVDPCVLWGEALANGSITQRIADNCAADGIPDDKTGAGVSALIYTSGGLGVLDPETSSAWTGGVVFTPQIGPYTDVALTVDYFDITVEGEVSQLGARTILYECYNSPNFPESEFCDLFERGADGNPLNVKNVFRKYINIDEQVNRGFDFTLRVSHDMGNMGTLSFLGQATLQTKDTLTRLGEDDDFNGDVGDPKFTGNAHLAWDINDWTLFYELTLIGKSSSVDDYLEDNGTLCAPTDDFIPVYQGDYCSRPYTGTVFYHNISVTKQIMERFELTLGVSNLFDTRPPQTSGVTRLGSSALVSQYDWLGQRAFLAFGAKF